MVQDTKEKEKGKGKEQHKEKGKNKAKGKGKGKAKGKGKGKAKGKGKGKGKNKGKGKGKGKGKSTSLSSSHGENDNLYSDELTCWKLSIPVAAISSGIRWANNLYFELPNDEDELKYIRKNFKTKNVIAISLMFQEHMPQWINALKYINEDFHHVYMAQQPQIKVQGGVADVLTGKNNNKKKRVSIASNVSVTTTDSESEEEDMDVYKTLVTESGANYDFMEAFESPKSKTLKAGQALKTLLKAPLMVERLVNMPRQTRLFIHHLKPNTAIRYLVGNCYKDHRFNVESKQLIRIMSEITMNRKTVMIVRGFIKNSYSMEESVWNEYVKYLTETPDSPNTHSNTVESKTDENDNTNENIQDNDAESPEYSESDEGTPRPTEASVSLIVSDGGTPGAHGINDSQTHIERSVESQTQTALVTTSRVFRYSQTNANENSNTQSQQNANENSNTQSQKNANENSNDSKTPDDRWSDMMKNRYLPEYVEESDKKYAENKVVWTFFCKQLQMWIDEYESCLLDKLNCLIFQWTNDDLDTFFKFCLSDSLSFNHDISRVYCEASRKLEWRSDVEVSVMYKALFYSHVHLPYLAKRFAKKEWEEFESGVIDKDKKWTLQLKKILEKLVRECNDRLEKEKSKQQKSPNKKIKRSTTTHLLVQLLNSCKDVGNKNFSKSKHEKLLFGILAPFFALNNWTRLSHIGRSDVPASYLSSIPEYSEKKINDVIATALKPTFTIISMCLSPLYMKQCLKTDEKQMSTNARHDTINVKHWNSKLVKVLQQQMQKTSKNRLPAKSATVAAVMKCFYGMYEWPLLISHIHYWRKGYMGTALRHVTEYKGNMWHHKMWTQVFYKKMIPKLLDLRNCVLPPSMAFGFMLGELFAINVHGLIPTSSKGIIAALAVYCSGEIESFDTLKSLGRFSGVLKFAKMICRMCDNIRNNAKEDKETEDDIFAPAALFDDSDKNNIHNMQATDDDFDEKCYGLYVVLQQKFEKKLIGFTTVKGPISTNARTNWRDILDNAKGDFPFDTSMCCVFVFANTKNVFLTTHICLFL